MTKHTKYSTPQQLKIDCIFALEQSDGEVYLLELNHVAETTIDAKAAAEALRASVMRQIQLLPNVPATSPPTTATPADSPPQELIFTTSDQPSNTPQNELTQWRK